MNSNLVKSVLIGMLIQAVIACSPIEQTYTVPELKSDEALRSKVSGWCRESPGERRDMPNCENARRALQELQFEAAKANIGK